MTTKSKRTLLSLILSTMLIVAMAFSMTACGGNEIEKPNIGHQSGDTKPNGDTQGTTGNETDVIVLGQGETIFDFSVVDNNGKETKYQIHTHKKKVGEALMEVELIQGEDGPYGLYVKTVADITLDYNADGMYWSFYINGEYAMTGVDVTEIKEGNTYMFKAEKS